MTAKTAGKKSSKTITYIHTCFNDYQGNRQIASLHEFKNSPHTLDCSSLSKIILHLSGWGKGEKGNLQERDSMGQGVEKGYLSSQVSYEGHKLHLDQLLSQPNLLHGISGKKLVGRTMCITLSSLEEKKQAKNRAVEITFVTMAKNNLTCFSLRTKAHKPYTSD